MLLDQYVTQNKTQFINKVLSISEKLGIMPEWLMAVMYKESGLNHRAYNPKGGATGLIQFMPATAHGLGTTTVNLSNMTNVEQLDYVYQYFKPYAKKIKNYPDLYVITFFPVAFGKPDNFVFETKKLRADIIAKYNPGIDLNKDLKITKSEFIEYSYRNFDKTVLNELKKKLQ